MRALNQHLRLLLESVVRPLEGRGSIPHNMEELFAALIQYVTSIDVIIWLTSHYSSTQVASESLRKVSNQSFGSRIFNSVDHTSEIVQTTQRVNDALDRFMVRTAS